MARDKFYEGFIAGRISSHKLVTEEGIDALERDIKKRNILKTPITVTEKEMDDYYNNTAKLLYHNIIASVLWTLHDGWNFGKKRLHDFKKAFDKNVEVTFDLDYMGEHYVRLEDYAVELNERYELGINVGRVAVLQDSYDKKSDKYHTLRTETVIKELKEHGFNEAAAFLEAKLD